MVAIAEYLKLNQDPQVIGATRLQRRLAEMGKPNRLSQAKETLKRYRGQWTHETENAANEGLPTGGGVGKKLREVQIRTLVMKLQRKKIHGVFAKQARMAETDKKATFEWLKEGNLQAETEAVIVAAQDGVTHTNAYRSRILREHSNPLCRACGKADETIGHILAGCESHRWSLYKDRHDICWRRRYRRVWG